MPNERALVQFPSAFSCSLGVRVVFFLLSRPDTPKELKLRSARWFRSRFHFFFVSSLSLFRPAFRFPSFLFGRTTKRGRTQKDETRTPTAALFSGAIVASTVRTDPGTLYNTVSDWSSVPWSLLYSPLFNEHSRDLETRSPSTDRPSLCATRHHDRISDSSSTLVDTRRGKVTSRGDFSHRRKRGIRNLN